MMVQQKLFVSHFKSVKPEIQLETTGAYQVYFQNRFTFYVIYENILLVVTTLMLKVVFYPPNQIVRKDTGWRFIQALCPF